MAKYKLISLSVVIAGRQFEKSENLILDTAKFPQGLISEFESAHKAGFLELVEEAIKVETPKKVIKKNDK
jgi:hypothetical protein